MLHREDLLDADERTQIHSEVTAGSCSVVCLSSGASAERDGIATWIRTSAG